MSYIDLTTTLAPLAPAPTHVELFINSANNHLSTINSSGTVTDFGGGTVNSGTSGQIAVYNGSTSITSGVTASMNNTKITSLANGTASTDAAAFGQIPTVSNSTFVPQVTGAGSVGVATGFYQQIGNMVHVWGSFQCGTPTAVSMKVDVPTGSIVYTNRLSTNGSVILGTAHDMTGGVNLFTAPRGMGLFADGSDTASVYFVTLTPSSGTAAWPKQNGLSLVSANDFVCFEYWYAVS